MTGVSKGPILRFLLTVGAACQAEEKRLLVNLPCQRIEADELWGFCAVKDANIRPERRGEDGIGSVWTWIALCADTKLIAAWSMGDRDGFHANALMFELSSRLTSRPQLSTDGLGMYAGAVQNAFRETGADYATITKQYGQEARHEARYSPPKCVGCERRVVCGDPDPKHISTSFVERANLTIRMQQRRWTRLTNAHSKKLCFMEAAFSLHSFHYNFARIHSTIKKTPAMAAKVADRPWTIGDIVGLVEAAEAAKVAAGAFKRGPYRKNSK